MTALLDVIPDLTELPEIVEPTNDFPEDFEPEPTGPLCEVCQTPIPWSGRGRKPRKCVDHKTRTTPKDGTPSKPRRSARTEARLANLEDALTRELSLFGTTISKVMPVTGVTAVGRAPKTSAALVALAAKNEKTLEVLESVTKIVPVLDLGETAVALYIAVMMDMGRIRPGSLPAAMSGVQEYWDLVYPEGEVVQEHTADPASQPHVGLPPVAVPPRFQKVEV